MKYKFIIVLIILVGVIAFPETGLGQLGLPLVKNFSPENYNGGIQNWQILQDARGIIYVANNYGLLQYDGNNWRTYNISEASKLRSIAIDVHNRIYAGFQGDFGYFEADSLGELQYTSLKNLISKKDRLGIGETWKTYLLNDKVYFCTFTNIYAYNGHTIETISHTKGLDVSYQSNSTLYTHVPGVGLHKLINNRLEITEFGLFFKDKVVSSLLSLNQNELLITTKQKGIYMVDNSVVKPWNSSLNNLFSNTFINSSILLSNGNIAIGTQHSGIYIVDQSGNILLHMDKDKGLLSRTILSLYEDQNHNLWVGQNNGLSFIELKSPFRKINEEAGLPGTGYAALKKGKNLYLGTNNGVYFKNDKRIQQIEGSEGQVYSIQSIDNKLLVGHNNGAFILQDGLAKNFDKSEGTWMFLKSNNYLLQGTYEGIKVRNANNLQEIGQVKGLNESSRIIVKENDSIVWMSHGYKGIYKLNFSESSPTEPKIEFYNQDNLLPTNLFNTVYSIGGKLKISTENGLYTYDHLNNSFIPDKSLNQYFKGDKINTLTNDIYGNIYFITTQTVGLLEKTGKSKYVKHTRPFNPIRKLLNDDLPNISIIGPNTVLFAAKEGFIVFDRNLFWTIEKEEFHTIIRQVKYRGDESQLLYNGNINITDNAQKSTATAAPKIAYTNNTILFNFSSTSFSTTLAPEFQYKLEGFDKDWHEWTHNNYKEYTNLREGDYLFKVKSRNANDLESEIASFSFTIDYPWYRSPFAYLIYTALSISALFITILIVNNKHQKEKHKLEQKRKHQLSEKDKQLDTITKQSETEINQLRNEKLESEIKHMNTELATNTMHLLNKNEFINSIKSTLGGVIKKSSNQEVKGQIGKIIKNIERNIETDGDWDNFQIHFDKVHRDFSRRIQLEFPNMSPQEIKLSAYLRLNLSTKEIANLLNISIRGVEIARYRLRKKLELKRSQNLAEFILNY